MLETGTFKLLFYINGSKKAKDGTCPIIMRITLNGQRTTLRVNRSVKPSNWNQKSSICKKNTIECEDINFHLDAFKSRAFKKYSELIAFNYDISAQIGLACLIDHPRPVQSDHPSPVKLTNQ